MADESLKILMMGARRAGKTSLLAGLVHNFLYGDAGKFLKVTDVTQGKLTEALAKKIEDLKKTVTEKNGKTILVDDSRTDTFNNYNLKVELPGINGNMTMTFTDVNGEFYALGDIHRKQVEDLVRTYDIFLIAVDTPYLMEAVNPENDLCTETINEAYNQVANVHTILSAIDDGNGNNARLVLFVPLKCEYWANNGKIENVTERIEEVYSTPICALKSFKNIEIAILPVQTVGSIEFESHKEALVVVSHDNQRNKCCILDNGNIRLPNGDIFCPTPDFTITDDTDSVIEGYGFVKPNSWFSVKSRNYAPHNCDQLTFFILQFALAKTAEAKKKQKKKVGRKLLHFAGDIAVFFAGGWLLLIAYELLVRRFGTINKNKLNDAINTIRDKGLWKTSGEGIKIIEKGLLS